MLYLFGRLALSDSLDYYENFQDDDDVRPAAPGERTSAPEPEVRTAPDRQPRRSAHLPQADWASTGCLSN